MVQLAQQGGKQVGQWVTKENGVNSTVIRLHQQQVVTRFSGVSTLSNVILYT